MIARIIAKKWLLLPAICVSLIALAWWQSTPVLCWYFVRELVAADAENREACVNRVISFDAAAVPGLLEQFECKDATICINVESALAALTRKWGPEDSRTLALADAIHERFGGMSPLGQIGSLQVMAAILHQDGPTNWPASLTRTVGDLLHACRDRTDLRSAALVLASILLDRVPPGQWLETCRALAEKGLTDRFTRSRLAAIQLLMRPAMQSEHALLAKVVPMLRDESAEIRRAAVVALAPAVDVVSEDDLLPLLHDSDARVQQLCEAALRGRGLNDAQLDLARLVSDESPKARLKVLERIGRTDVDRAAWLRRLSQDPCSAIRAAAIRAAMHYPQMDFRDRLREMAQHDPSETVRQNALHFLSQTTDVPR